MLYSVLTYSRNLGDFSVDLVELHKYGLKAIRLIYKGKSEEAFNLRINEIQKKFYEHSIDIDIFIDLPGNKPIVGDLPKGFQIDGGVEYEIVDSVMTTSLATIPTVNFFNNENFKNLADGDIISVADDELNLRVKEVTETVVLCEAINSLYLTSNRSISVKDNPFVFTANSEKDIHFVRTFKHAQTNIKLLVSFTKNAEDLNKLKSLQPKMDVVPKIENILDDQRLIEIIDGSEMILLGRGDLSTASKPNEIFKYQSHLVNLCKKRNKKLIVGTGLLSGISDKLTPTISEIMDYSSLRSMGIESFLISGSNGNNQPLNTLKFMREFEV